MSIRILTLTVPFGLMWFMLAGIANSGCDNIGEGVFLDACNEQKNWMVPTFLVIGFIVIGIGIYYFMLYGRNDDEPKLSDEKSPAPTGIDKYENWSDDWRDFQIKKDAMDKKNRADSEAILKKYDSMPFLSQETKSENRQS